jgi:hypothetical protein
VDQLYQKAKCKDMRENQQRLKDAGFLVDAPQASVEQMYRALAFMPAKATRRNAICRFVLLICIIVAFLWFLVDSILNS